MAFEAGQWNVICDRCGHKFKARQLRVEWTGLRVCHGPGSNNCWEPRHPQDFVKGRKDYQAPPWVRPEPPPISAVELALILDTEGKAIEEFDFPGQYWAELINQVTPDDL